MRLKGLSWKNRIEKVKTQKSTLIARLKIKKEV